MVSRATFLLMISQVIFMVSGFLIHAGLARILQPVDYGTFGLVMSILVVVEVLVITGIPEAIRKYGGEQPEVMKELIKKTLSWQLGYCVAVFLLFWLISPLIAAFFNDKNLTFLLRLASLDIIIYGLYKFYLAAQNGLHRFESYTTIGIIYSITKLAAIMGLVWLGFSVSGALIGNMVGSLVALVFAFVFTRLKDSDETPETVHYLWFAGQNVFYFVGLNLLFSIDLWFVKYFLEDANVGLYVSAGLFAKLTYSLSLALSAVLLPSISRAVKLQQSRRIRDLTKESIRYVTIALVLLNIIVILNAKGIIRLFFGEEYLSAEPILSMLMVGLSMITLTAIINTIMIAKDSMRNCLIQVLLLVALDVILNIILVPKLQMYGAAISTFLVGLVGMIMAGMHVWTEFKSVIFSMSMVRLTGVTLILIVVSQFLSEGKPAVFINPVIIGAIYLSLLWFTKEITAVDLRRLKESVGIDKS